MSNFIRERIVTMYKTVVNKLNQGLYMWQENRFLWVNNSFAELFGYTMEEFQSVDEWDLIYLEDQNQLSQNIMKITSGEIEQFDLEIRGVQKDKSIIHILLSSKRIIFENKPSAVGSVLDITERKCLENRLKESNERYRNLVENLAVGIMVHQNGILEYVNPMAMRLLGASSSKEIVGQSIYKLIHDSVKDKVTERVQQITKLGKSVPMMYQKLRRLDGTLIDVEASGMPIHLNGKPAVEVTFWDVTKKKQEEVLMKYRAYHDLVTDLPNRHKFQKDFDDEFNHDRQFTMLFLDIEDIRDILEQHGVQATNTLLIKLAGRLLGAMEQKGLVYRLESDLFAVVLPGEVDDRELFKIVEKIRSMIQQPVYLNNSIIQVSINVGVVYYPKDGVTLDTILQHAQLANMQAKKAGTAYEKYDG